MFDKDKRAYIAISNDVEICLVPKMANRHGLITGATGTGKTVTLQNLAETFSEMGVPVFAADVKGDLSGVSQIGGNKESVTKRVDKYDLKDKGFTFENFPTQFWDVFGKGGTPVRATISEMGVTLLTRLLSLNDTQSSILTIVFKIAKDEGWDLIDLKDLQKSVEYIGNNYKQYITNYGNISIASIGAIQRGLLKLEESGVGGFFGTPNLNLDDLIQTKDGKGVINLLIADQLMNTPQVYTTFLLWMLTELFEVLPEVGDMEKPKLVFFFDEAHLLFNDAPKALLEKIEQVVRLIRSKGVGIYFITQTPSDIPDSVLGQLGNRVQHALRAYTPKDQKALKAAADSFRANDNFDTRTAITELSTGEALISFLDAKGAPTPVERGFILPPQGQIGAISDEQRRSIISNSALNKHYANTEDRTSAYEILSEKMNRLQQEHIQQEKAKQEKKEQVQASKEQQARTKAQHQSAQQTKRFWGTIVTAIIIPIIKALIGSSSRKK